MNSTALALNDNATQQLNDRYKRATGSSTLLSAIKAFTVIGYIGVFLSIVGSTLGFYHDFYKIPLLRDIWISLPLAITFGITLDYARHHLIDTGVAMLEKGKIIVSAIFIGLAFIITVFAIAMHFRGMSNMEQNTNMNTLKDVVKHERTIELEKLKQSNDIIGTVNKMTSNAYTNGDLRDDILVAKTAKNYGNLVAKLTSSPTTSYATKAMIRESEESAKTTKESMSTLLPIIEAFTFFSLLAKVLLLLIVDKGAKQTASMYDKMQETKGEMYTMVQQLMLNKSNSEMVAVMSTLLQDTDSKEEKTVLEDILYSIKKKIGDQQGSNSPTPQQTQPTKQQLDGHYNPFKWSKSEEKETDDKLNSYDGTTSDAERREQFEVKCDEIDIEEIVELPKVIDSKLFSDDEEKLIQAMWANGTRRVGHTYTKRDVERYFTDSELYSPVQIKTLMYIYTPLNVKLTGQGFVKLINGYGYEVLVEMSSVHKV